MKPGVRADRQHLLHRRPERQPWAARIIRLQGRAPRLTRAAAKELASLASRQAVCPGMIDTELSRETAPREDLERRQGVPGARLGTPWSGRPRLLRGVGTGGLHTGASFDINGGDPDALGASRPEAERPVEPANNGSRAVKSFSSNRQAAADTSRFQQSTGVKDW